MNKVFVVIEDWACDFEIGNSVVAFSSIEKARAYMSKRYKEVRQEYDYSNEEFGADSFSFYEDGEYANNHTDLKIEEVEIDKWV